MLIREAISQFIAHFSPLALLKHVFPAHKCTQAYTHPTHNEFKPWMNVDEVELTAEDFAG
jgi:hypothetical protein